jgi:Thioredoxin-like
VRCKEFAGRGHWARQAFRRNAISLLVLLFACGAAPLCRGQTDSLSAAADFAPLVQWKNAALHADEAALRSLYSLNPVARIKTTAGDVNSAADVAFWIGWKARRLKLQVLQFSSPRPEMRQIIFEAEVDPADRHTVYVSEAQLWQQQSAGWRLVAAERTDPARLEQPVLMNKDIYPADVDARAEIRQALAEAAKARKRVLLVFGANWCYDCHVLDLAFRRSDLAPLLARDFEVVHVDVGEGDKNQDLMQQYQVPMKKGIPALAVLESDGKLLYSQKGGEFENARSLTPEDLLRFLNKWKPAR